MDARIGTSGWQYDHWRGDFYPHDLPKARWFEYYAERFDTVEVNNTFYRQPANGTWDRWREMAPAGFCFAVKANRFLTHIRRLVDAAPTIERFFSGALRLDDRLGPVLYQLPPFFERTPERAERFEAFLALLPRGPDHVVEFRHRSWYTEPTMEALRRHAVSLCIHDMPRLESPVVATCPVVYARFHGAGTAYSGNYSDEALRGWAERFKALEGVERLWAYFNNDIGGHAIRNAATFRAVFHTVD